MSIGVDQISEALVSLGFPAEQCTGLAQHLDRRARQLAEQRNRTYDEAVAHLLRMMVVGAAGSNPQAGSGPSAGNP